jgi:hypothetical protein
MPTGLGLRLTFSCFHPSIGALLQAGELMPLARSFQFHHFSNSGCIYVCYGSVAETRWRECAVVNLLAAVEDEVNDAGVQKDPPGEFF